MHATTIAELAQLTLDGTLLFPEILGRHGDQHVEWFPGAAPADA
ncbi:hypothetical protein [Limnohabitans sp. JirII-29]|nr:hypothetical protein [Limnohabitans sp. JirII-29]